jgi:DNA replication protein DnaC
MSELKTKKPGEVLNYKFQELQEDFFDCPRHGKYRGKPVNYSRGPRIKVCVNPECPQCAEERRAKEANDKAIHERKEAAARLEDMNMGKKFWGSTFENFDAYNEELRHHLAVAKKFAERPNGELVMIGENGNGKNHLAAAILKKAGGVIYTCSEIGIMLRECYNGKNSEAELFHHLCTVPLLIIDELDKAKESEAKNNWMSHIIGKRYNNMLPAVLVANGHLQEDCKKTRKPCPRCIEYHLENDVLSRIFEDGILLKFNSPDYRYTIREGRGRE